MTKEIIEFKFKDFCESLDMFLADCYSDYHFLNATGSCIMSVALESLRHSWNLAKIHSDFYKR